MSTDPKMTALSPRQQETLAFIRERIGANSRTPTMQEIADHFGIGKTAAFSRVRMLMKKGVVAHRVYGARTLQLEETPARELARLVLQQYPDNREACRLAEKVLRE